MPIAGITAAQLSIPSVKAALKDTVGTQANAYCSSSGTAGASCCGISTPVEE